MLPLTENTHLLILKIIPANLEQEVITILENEW